MNSWRQVHNERWRSKTTETWWNMIALKWVKPVEDRSCLGNKKTNFDLPYTSKIIFTWMLFDIWDVGVSQNNNGCRRKGKKSWPGKGVEVIKLKATCWKKGRKRPMREKFRNGRWEAGSEKDKWRGQWSKQMDTLKEILGRWRRLGGKAEGRDVAKMDREHCAQRQRLA